MTDMRTAIAIAMLFAVSPAWACSISNNTSAFAPDKRSFLKEHDFPPALVMPAPDVQIVSVQRATSDVPGSCRYYTFVSIHVSVPVGSMFRLSELGFVFRTSSASALDAALSFPNVPIVSGLTEDGKSMSFVFGFIDPPSGRARPFSLPLEVFAINHGLQVGPSAMVAVVQP